jgi:hypothetical protein
VADALELYQEYQRWELEHPGNPGITKGEQQSDMLLALGARPF